MSEDNNTSQGDPTPEEERLRDLEARLLAQEEKLLRQEHRPAVAVFNFIKFGWSHYGLKVFILPLVMAFSALKRAVAWVKRSRMKQPPASAEVADDGVGEHRQKRLAEAASQALAWSIFSTRAIAVGAGLTTLLAALSFCQLRRQTNELSQQTSELVAQTGELGDQTTTGIYQADLTASQNALVATQNALFRRQLSQDSAQDLARQRTEYLEILYEVAPCGSPGCAFGQRVSDGECLSTARARKARTVKERARAGKKKTTRYCPVAPLVLRREAALGLARQVEYAREQRQVAEVAGLPTVLGLRNVDARGGTWVAVDLSYADLVLSDFSRSIFTEVEFGGARADGANFSGSDFRKVKMVGFAAAGFHESRFKGTRFLGGDLTRATLTLASFTNAEFRDGAVLYRTKFTRSELQGARFESAPGNKKLDMRLAIFSDANLRESRFVRADLANADFQGACLEEAAFSKVDLTDVVWAGAHLERASFVEVEGLDLGLCSHCGAPPLIDGQPFEGCYQLSKKACGDLLHCPRVKTYSRSVYQDGDMPVGTRPF